MPGLRRPIVSAALSGWPLKPNETPPQNLLDYAAQQFAAIQRRSPNTQPATEPAPYAMASNSFILPRSSSNRKKYIRGELNFARERKFSRVRKSLYDFHMDELIAQMREMVESWQRAIREEELREKAEVDAYIAFLERDAK
jgi:hypothetical protein